MQDIALQQFHFAHIALDCNRLNGVAHRINELIKYFTTILQMSNPEIAAEDAYIAKTVFIQWLELSLVVQD